MRKRTVEPVAVRDIPQGYWDKLDAIPLIEGTAKREYVKTPCLMIPLELCINTNMSSSPNSRPNWAKYIRIPRLTPTKTDKTMMISAIVLAFARYFGRWPKINEDVIHICDNGTCLRYGHFGIGPRALNKIHQAKSFDPAEVALIKSLHKLGFLLSGDCPLNYADFLPRRTLSRTLGKSYRSVGTLVDRDHYPVFQPDAESDSIARELHASYCDLMAACLARGEKGAEPAARCIRQCWDRLVPDYKKRRDDRQYVNKEGEVRCCQGPPPLDAIDTSNPGVIEAKPGSESRQTEC